MAQNFKRLAAGLLVVYPVCIAGNWVRLKGAEHQLGCIREFVH